MLNKNQSKKWNSWKYALVIPALVAFVILFQIKVIAQEKVSINSTEKTTSIDKILVIDKNTSDASLKQLAIDLKNNHGVTLNVSKVKRNANGEITGIKISFKDQEGNSGVNQANGDKPIQPITFLKNKDENGKTLIGFFTPNHIDKEIKINNVNAEDVIAIQNPGKSTSVTTTTNGTKMSEPIVYVNGVRTDDNINDIDPQIIASIDIVKGLNTAQYGKYEENGVISITTKNGIEIPTPPTPPTPPNVPNFTVKSPKFPKAPKAPKGSPVENKEMWKKYEKQMKEYELQVEKMEPEMGNYEENMKVYEEKMKAYEEKMKVYEEKMGDYEKKMEEYFAKQNK